VGSSPHYRSRIFAQFTGCTVSQYRNRLRVSWALDRIGGGQKDLTGMPHDLRFSDHAHLTRTHPAATSHTPTTCRALPTDSA
jgi:AraC-like DNA-binding protein